jgi:UDP-N-acetylmuramoylalanine--D-glutamate ligase
MSPPAIDHDPPQLQLFDLAGRTVLVLGLGESGEAMARWAASRGASLRLADTRSADGSGLERLVELRAALGDCPFLGGPFDCAWLDGVDLVAWSPGLSIELGESAAFYAQARERGIAVMGELDLFVHALAALADTGYRPRVVAITGTNGKTTTTALAAHLFAATGRSVRAAGNIGPSLLAALADCLEHDALPDIWVLELSSFQLALAQGFEPDAASVLNLTEDHLDWHVDLARYGEAKRRIHGARAWVVFNRDDPATVPRPAPAPARPVGARSGRRPPVDLPPARPSSSFGFDAPRRPGDLGIVQDGGLGWIACAEADDPMPGRAREADVAVVIRKLMPAEALKLRGRHNQANAMAALALGLAIGLPLAPMLRAIRDFDANEHRCEWVATVNGVQFVNDSKGTNVGATVAALEAMPPGTVLIAGGVGKGQDFNPLARALARRAGRAVLIGRDALAIAEALAELSVPFESCADLRTAVQRAAELAGPDKTVLLSPACASFDMFTSYADRGHTFRKLVRERALEAGQPMELAC